MLSGIFRVLFGFALAALSSAAVHVLFAHPPAEIVETSALAGRDTIASSIEFLLKIAAHLAVFAVPFVLIAVAVSEGLRVQSLPFYLVSGLGIAAMGLYARMKGESPGDATILNAYAALAFASAGLIGGYVYWAVAGWRAGGRTTAWDDPALATAGRRLRVEADDRSRFPGEPTAGAGVAGVSDEPNIAKAPPPPAPSRPSRFKIERSPFDGDKPRLVASQKLERTDFEAIADAVPAEVRRARKIGFVAARKAENEEAVTTHWNGKETANVARPGDWIVTSMSPEKTVLADKDGNANTYVIKAETFPLLYESVEGENEHGAFFRAMAIVDSIYLPGGFDIVAPWGERQMAEKGYLIMNGKDVYGNHAETFEASYETVT